MHDASARMKRWGLAGVVVASLLLPAIRAGADAYQGSNDTETLTTTVLSQINITESGTQKLNFGMFVAGTALNYITVSPAGVRTFTGGIKLLGSGASADLFTVTGDTSNPSFSITLPGSAVTLTSGSYTMTVDTFTSTPSGTGTMSSGTLNITVGARLNVGANQHAGAYTGSYTITVAYH